MTYREAHRELIRRWGLGTCSYDALKRRVAEVLGDSRPAPVLTTMSALQGQRAITIRAKDLRVTINPERE